MFDRNARVSAQILQRMLASIRHRGPDDEGIYQDCQVGLGHRRLSIIDLSSGHQPLSNEDGSVWIVFNGEIYNYQELRDFLITKGHLFNTKTDTEVIVHLYEEFGPQCVDRLRGMFAFAIWDQRQRALLLARDRIGIKPLYYHVSHDFVVFGSEIKAILADPEVEREISPAIIDRFLTFNYVPGEETTLKNIYKLAPGSFLFVKDGRVERQQYWDLQFTKSAANEYLKNAQRKLTDLLEEAVDLHMISDVPVGFLLSGGVDSTAMLSLASKNAPGRISSFTVGFSDPDIPDERPYARLAAERFGSDHHEITISARDFSEFLPKYVWHMEEPVCEPPAIALYYVSRLARSHVKVLISGEGGDEAFAGYSNYRNILWFERFKRAFKPFDGFAAAILGGISCLTHSREVARYRSLVDVPLASYYYSRSANSTSYFNTAESHLWSEDLRPTIDKEYSLEPVRRLFAKVVDCTVLDQMLYVDTKTWLPDDLLLKADKMTMANSVELRVPLLDHKILEFAASLPARHKIRGFKTKYIAKRVLRNAIPAQILRRKKAGFPIPYESWLRNELRGWVREILLDSRTTNRGYFNKAAIDGLLSKNLEFGHGSREIFSLVALELWNREFLEENVPAAVD
jgi:asparagine synthase (glutamine-hydrolysing)